MNSIHGDLLSGPTATIGFDRGILQWRACSLRVAPVFPLKPFAINQIRAVIPGQAAML
jgi:hypothetical protein